MKRAVFLELSVPLPALAIQKKIVEIVDEMYASIEDLTSSAERVVPHSQSAMAKLLNELAPND
jgi:restriction endonuclease S subunit